MKETKSLAAFEKYLEGVEKIVEGIREQREVITKAADLMAQSITNGGMIHLFGSGHSVLPVLDAFPRYGSFLGFNPLVDPRLMWFSPSGPASAPGLLLTERREGYVVNGFLRYQPLVKGDVLIVYSHSGVNAAPVECALYAKQRGLSVIAILSVKSQINTSAKHSSGKKLSEIADIVINNCVPPEDAIVPIEGRKEKIAACSTLAGIMITMCLIAETGTILSSIGKDLKIFVAPTMPGFDIDYNFEIFDLHQKLIADHYKKLYGG